MKIVKLPQALIDLVETAEYLAEDDAEVADRFFDAFETTIGFIVKTPKIGSVKRYRDQTDIRMCLSRVLKRA